MEIGIPQTHILYLLAHTLPVTICGMLRSALLPERSSSKHISPFRCVRSGGTFIWPRFSMSHSGTLTFSLAMLTQDSVDTNTLTLQVTELLHGKLTPTTLTPFLPLVPRLLQSAILGSRSLWEERQANSIGEAEERLKRLKLISDTKTKMQMGVSIRGGK